MNDVEGNGMSKGESEQERGGMEEGWKAGREIVYNGALDVAPDRASHDRHPF